LCPDSTFLNEKNNIPEWIKNLEFSEWNSNDVLSRLETEFGELGKGEDI